MFPLLSTNLIHRRRSACLFPDEMGRVLSLRLQRPSHMHCNPELMKTRPEGAVNENTNGRFSWPRHRLIPAGSLAESLCNMILRQCLNRAGLSLETAQRIYLVVRSPAWWVVAVNTTKNKKSQRPLIRSLSEHWLKTCITEAAKYMY